MEERNKSMRGANNVVNLRRVASEAAYQEAKKTFPPGCPLCRMEAIKEFKYWKIIVNEYPYDRIATMHHMLVPLRHVVERELTADERQECVDIKLGYIGDTYEKMLEPSRMRHNIHDHYHLHLMNLHDIFYND